jgi:hypothetical protein
LDYRSKDCCTRCITGPGKQEKITSDGSARLSTPGAAINSSSAANLQSTVPTLRTRAQGSPR